MIPVLIGNSKSAPPFALLYMMLTMELFTKACIYFLKILFCGDSFKINLVLNSGKKLNAIFCIMVAILGNIGSILIK